MPTPAAWPTAGATSFRAILLLAALMVSLSICSCGDVPDAARVVAKVNDQEITYGDLVRELEARHGPTALLSLIDDAVVRAEAARRGLGLSARERQLGLDRAAARVGSMADLRLKLQRAGIPIEAYQHEIDTDLLLDKIVAQEVKVTDAQIAAFYEQHKEEFERGPRVRARMMLFRDRSNAEALMEVLDMPGADFAGLARRLSEDDATRDAGGDTGYFEKEDYAPAISDVAFKLEPDEMSGIIQAPDGWVILRVEGTKPAGPLGLDEVKDQICARIAREKQYEMRATWLVKAREAVALVIPDSDLRATVQARINTPRRLPMPGEL